jgi:hypothetical protein
MYLNNLGKKLGRRFERTGRMESLEESIRRAQQVVNIPPHGAEFTDLDCLLRVLPPKVQQLLTKFTA